MTTRETTSQFPPNPDPRMSEAEWHALCTADDAWRERKRKEADERDAAERRQAERAGHFRTDHEDGCSPWFGDDKPAAALMFNPNASPLSIAAAALARADCLRQSLMAWSCTDGGATAQEVTQALEPTGQEVVLLLDELITRLGRAEKAQSQGVAHG